MPGLRDLQTRITSHLLDQKDAALTEQIVANGLTGERRLQVYKNNVFASLTEALRAVYPVIEKLVGEKFFDHCADQFIRATPSRSGDLYDFGREFAEFLQNFRPAQQHSYLSDVARLEWSYHEVFHAADHESLDIQRLQDIRPSDYDRLIFKLHPAARLLASEFPILKIWQVNQDEYNGEASVDLDEGGIKLLTIRRQFEIEFEPLGDAEHCFLSGIGNGQNFASVCEQSLATDESFDLNQALIHHVNATTIVEFELTDKNYINQ